MLLSVYVVLVFQCTPTRMSLSRSSAATAILRALARSSSPAQQPKTCFECLVNPTSCQISHIAAGASAASRGSGQPFPRYQSTSSTPTVTSDIAASSSTAIPQQRARVASSANAEEAPIATTSAEPSTSNVVAGQSQPEKPLPTLDDLDALKSRKLTVPDEAEPATSAVVGMYTRRFKNLYSRVNRAFNKEQVAHLARAASIISNHETHRPKAELVRKLMTDYWDLTDPALYAVRESGRSRHDSQQPQDVVEGQLVS